MDGLIMFTSRLVERSFKLWLIITFGSAKFVVEKDKALTTIQAHIHCTQNVDIKSEIIQIIYVNN
jgi:hypothetical protein